MEFEIQMMKEEEEDHQNANPLPRGTHSSPHHQQAGGTMSETTTMVIDSAVNSDVVASHVVNDVIATTTTTTQPKNTPVLQFELQMLKEEANLLPPGTDSSAHQQAGGTMSETTSTVMHTAGDTDVVMHSAGDSDVVASHVVNDVIATTAKTQPKTTPVFQCEICNITFRTQNVLERHKLGKKHSKTLQKQPQNTAVLECEICNITCDAQSMLERHKLGRKHLKTLQWLAETSAIDTHLADTNGLNKATSECSLSSGPGKKSATFQCEVCKISCNSNELLNVHLSGKKHHANVQLLDTNGLKNATSECGSSGSPRKKSATFQCEVCEISCNSKELLNMHLSGKKHLKKIEQLEEIPDPSDQPESTEGNSVELHQGMPLSCNLCGIACNSYNMLKKHNSGKKHQKNLENSLKPIGPNPAPTTEPVTTAPMMIGPLQDEGKMVKADGSNGEAKRAREHEEVETMETKKQKLSQGGASNALNRCMLCHVVCTSPELLISHFAGKKHLKLALQQAKSQFD